jgi:hypothetical protein
LKIPQKVSFSSFQAARGFITKSLAYRNAIKDWIVFSSKRLPVTRGTSWNRATRKIRPARQRKNKQSSRISSCDETEILKLGFFSATGEFVPERAESSKQPWWRHARRSIDDASDSGDSS